MTLTPTAPPRHADAQVDQQIDALEARLLAEAGGQTAIEQVIREYLADARERFANASIRTFLPILIERSVRARLRLESAV